MAHYKRKCPRTVGCHRCSSKAPEYRLKLDAQDLRWLQSYPRWHDKPIHTRPARHQTKLLTIEVLKGADTDALYGTMSASRMSITSKRRQA